MKGEIYPFQVVGKEFLKSKRFALLADEMGMGKSVQAILAAKECGHQRILVICVAIGRINWKEEYKSWINTGLDIQILQKDKDLVTNSAITICSYDYAEKHGKKLSNFDLIIFDEAHSLKSPTAKRTVACLGNNGLIRRTKRAWFLTGTPAMNHYGELWTILYTCGRTNLKYNEFVKRYCYVIDTEYGPIIKGNKVKMVNEIKEMLNGFMLKRKKEKGMLPDIYFSDVYVEKREVDFELSKSFFSYVFPDDDRVSLYEKLSMEERAVEAVLGSNHNGNGTPVAALEGLAKSVTSLRKYHGLQKLESIVELVSTELDNGEYEKIVIFAIHRDFIEILFQKLKKYHPVILYGGMTDEKKARMIDKFNRNKGCKVFIGNILACGTTINLTVANQVLFGEYDWTPGNNAQAAMRVHRIGQKKPVQIRYAIMKDSLDQKIQFILKRKTKELLALYDDETKENDSLDLTEIFEKIQTHRQEVERPSKNVARNSLINENPKINNQSTEEIDIFS